MTSSSLISSPGHPFTSGPHMNCTWIVRSGGSNQVVRFRLEQMELEFHPLCSYDYVKLYDGSAIRDDKLIATFCGNLTQDEFHPILSKGREMTILFLTDWSIQHTGFRAAVDFTPGQTQGCGGQLNVTASGGQVVIQSVDANGDGKYDADLDCQWLIGGPDYESLEVTFETFNLEGRSVQQGRNVNVSGGECPYDFVEVKK